MVRPAAVARLTRASSENFPSFPRSRSLRRGRVIPRRAAAASWGSQARIRAHTEELVARRSDVARGAQEGEAHVGRHCDVEVRRQRVPASVAKHGSKSATRDADFERRYKGPKVGLRSDDIDIRLVPVQRRGKHPRQAQRCVGSQGNSNTGRHDI